MATVIKLMLDDKSQGLLRKFVDENKELIKFPKDEFHSTVFYSENNFPQEDYMTYLIKKFLPIDVYPPYNKEIFDDNLVFKYTNNKVDSIADYLKGKTKDNSYNCNPHITLAKKFPRYEGIEKLTWFEEPLTFVDLEWDIK